MDVYSNLIALKKRQAGRRYESYVAWSLRRDGWDVIETGRAGVNDHGIDLIATRNGKKRYVQCKGWKRWKTVGDDVVSQLYGSVANLEGADSIKNIEMFIYSPAKLSNYAQAEADRLHITYARRSFPHWRRKSVNHQPR